MYQSADIRKRDNKRGGQQKKKSVVVFVFKYRWRCRWAHTVRSILLGGRAVSFLTWMMTSSNEYWEKEE